MSNISQAVLFGRWESGVAYHTDIPCQVEDFVTIAGLMNLRLGLMSLYVMLPQCLPTDADRSLSPIDVDGRREDDVTWW